MNFKVSRILVEWYNKNKRDLPWRHTHDPYLIWISEIILQQTRVIQGIEYYFRFIERFPDIMSLALAKQEEVLKYWQGLGYYSRARNLHETAQFIQKNLEGIFPQDYEKIIQLKGIGRYTAAAIASFAWNQPYPVIDGNVFRVISRLFAIHTPTDTAVGKKEYLEIAKQLLEPKQAGIHNQAIMEFGALHCTPQNPNCKECPLTNQCIGFTTKNPQQFPFKKNKTKTRDRYFHYFFIINQDSTYLFRRTGKDIWEGLFEFPLIETDTALDFADLKKQSSFNDLFHQTDNQINWKSASKVKHVLSHQILHVTFYIVETQKEIKGSETFIKIPLKEIPEYPVPTLIHTFLLNYS